MSAFNTEKYLEHRGVLSRDGAPITADRKCPKCRYNLKGLRIGDPCPECGRPATFRLGATGDDNLLDAPVWYIRLLQLGFTLLALGGVGGVVLMILLPFSPDAARAGLLGAAAAWMGGVLIACAPRPASPKANRTGNDLLELRIAACVTQAAWPAVVIVGTLAANAALRAAPARAAGGAGPSPLWGWAVMGLLAVALAGVVPLSLTLARLARWASDDDRADALRSAGWWLVLAVGLTVVADAGLTAAAGAGWGGIVGAIGFLFLAFTRFAVVAAAVYLLWSLWALSRMAAWAVRNARHRREIDDELRARKARDAEEMQRRLDAAAAGTLRDG